MFYLITGAAASGKTTMVRNLIEKLPHIECHDSDEIPYKKDKDRGSYTNEWISIALEAQKNRERFSYGSTYTTRRVLSCT